MKNSAITIVVLKVIVRQALHLDIFLLILAFVFYDSLQSQLILNFLSRL